MARSATSNDPDQRTRQRDILLWIGVLLGPIAAASHLMLCYALVRPSQRQGSATPIFMTTVVALGFVAVGALIAWRTLRAIGPARASPEGRARSRSRFMALSGLGLSAFSGLLVLAVAYPSLIYKPWE